MNTSKLLDSVLVAFELSKPLPATILVSEPTITAGVTDVGVGSGALLGPFHCDDTPRFLL